MKAKKVRTYFDKKARKKHVESMFLTNKVKRYPYYFKDRKLSKRIENNKNNFFPKRYFYTVKILKSGYITAEPLKAIMRLYKWFLKNQGIELGLKLRLTAFPDFVLTSKPKEIRMGKGKGTTTKKVSVIKKGASLFTLENRGVSSYLAERLLYMLTRKVPMRYILIKNFW